MASNITFNGVTYSIPADGDSGWGPDLTAYLIAISTGALTRAGGSFTLTSEIDFGNTFGIRVAYLKAIATSPAGSGVVRLGNTDPISWRNGANNADLELKVNASDVLEFNGASISIGGDPVQTEITVSDTSTIDLSLVTNNLTADVKAASIDNTHVAVSAAIAYSKLNLSSSIVNADINASAAIAYSKLNLSGGVVNADINASAAIALSKLAALTTSRALQSNASTGAIEVSAVTSVELGYLSGVTSAIQTQLNAKQDSSTAVTLTGTQTLTNKTLTSPTLNTPNVDIDTFTDQSSTPSTPAAGKRKLYSKTTGKFYQLDSTGVERELGSGGTGVNFVVGGDAESGSIFATYADAAGAAPVDGTGGVPSITSATTSSSSPLSGANSFLLAHPALNTQGNGWSYDFTIDNANKAKVLNIEFDYLISAGTFVPGSPGVDSDITVWIYDITNAQLIQPSSYKLLSNSSTIADHFSATFQTASNSTSYRFILHNGKSTATAFTIKLDSLSISPSKYIYGTPITDWQSYTPTVSNLGTGSLTTNTGYWRRVGDSMEVMIYNVKDGSAGTGSSAVLWSLPSNYSMDTAKIPSASNRAIVGVLSNAASGAVQNIFYNSATTVYSYNSGGQWNGSSFSAGLQVGLQFTVPIVGWSSSIQMSDQYDGRSVEMFIRGQTPTQTTVATTTGGSSNMSWGSADFDSHSGWSTGTYTVKVSGRYNVAGFIQYQASVTSSGEALFLVMLKNGTGVQQAQNTYYSAAGGASISFNFKDDFIAGDVISFRLVRTAGITQNVFSTSLINITRVPAVSTISATESYNLKYVNTAGTSLASGNNTLTFPTKQWDSHGSFSSNTTFTPNISGKFAVSLKIAANTITGLSTCLLRILVNGSTVSEKGYAFSYSTASPWTWDLVDDIQLNAGDAVTFVFQNGFGSSITQDTSAGRNTLSIHRVGN